MEENHLEERELFFNLHKNATWVSSILVRRINIMLLRKLLQKSFEPAEK